MPSPLRPMLWTLPLAFALWFLIFGVSFGNFWLKLALSASLLAVIGLLLSRDHWKILFQAKRRDLWLGPLSALFLYGIFWLGKELSPLFFPFASQQISHIYLNKAQLDVRLIGLLLFFVVGPAEEIFWRGLIQRSLSQPLGPERGLFLTVALYSLVHMFAFNFILLVAASVCGLFWGWLYQKEQRLVPVIFSHSLWDVTIFVLFPLSS